MANILYGVNGEGSGHSTRAKEVLRHLVRQGQTVHVASFDRGLQNLRDEFEVTEIYGLRLSYVNNRVRYEKTIAKNLLATPKAVKSNHQLLRLAEEWKINLVITDFEPMTCHVGHRKHLPIIAIDNQHCITNAEVSYPRQYRRDAAATKLVAKLMTPRADAYIVISFFPAEVKKKNTFLFSPLLRQEVLSAKPMQGDSVLVYVTSPSPKLAEMLQSVRCRFVAYGFGKEGVSGNVTFKRPTLDGFLADLVACKAVIANSGFSLISEALHLGKPYLAIPVAHQFEQIFNAYYLDKVGYGAYWEALSKEKIESFLFNLEVYRENLAQYPRQDNCSTDKTRRPDHAIHGIKGEGGGSLEMAITRLGLNDPEQSEKPASLIGVAFSMSLAITVLAIILFSWIADEMSEGDTMLFDANVRSFVHSFSSPALTKTMFALSFMGAGGMVVVLAAAVILFVVKKWYRGLGWLALTMAGAAVLSVTLKYGFHRARPVAFFGVLPNSYSFPSGHALFSFCFYGVMAGLINARVRSHGLRIVVWFIAAIMVAGIGLSRIYLGVHYPSDVLAGYLAGAIWVSTMITLDRLHKTRRGLAVATVEEQ